MIHINMSLFLINMLNNSLYNLSLGPKGKERRAIFQSRVLKNYNSFIGEGDQHNWDVEK